MKSKILLIRFSAMGDVAILATLLARVHQQYPHTKVVVLTKKPFDAMFQSIPNVTTLTANLKGEHKGFLGLYRLFKTLKEQQFDAVLDAHNVLRTLILRFFYKIFSSKTPFYQLNKGRKEKKALTRAENKVFQPLKTTYQRYADLLTKIGMPLELSENQFLTIPQKSEKVNDFIKSLPQSKIIGIAPFAAHQGKMYPFEKMQKVIQELSKEPITLLLFGGGASEKEKLEKVAQAYPNVESVVGKFSFAEELELIAQLDLMVAMDSGNAHLSAMYGAPTVTIWGVTHPYAGFYPYAQPMENALLADRTQYPLIPTSVYGNKYPEGYEKVMETISVESIINTIKERLF